MVEDDGKLDGLFHALASGARREILSRLADHPLTVGELARSLGMSLAGASKHIKVLERIGLVEQTVAGRTRVCRLVALPLAPAAGWLGSYRHHWEDHGNHLESGFRPDRAHGEPAGNRPARDIGDDEGDEQ